jgi:hypothetical protein
MVSPSTTVHAWNSSVGLVEEYVYTGMTPQQYRRGHARAFTRPLEWNPET